VKNTLRTNKLWEAQTLALKTLESQLKCLESATKDLQYKVHNDKLSAHYSQNNDCLSYAVGVWKTCLRLAELKKLQWELEGRDPTGKVIKED